MAKAHCAKHKRYVHNCIGCQSEALKETVGFPKAEAEAQPPDDPDAPIVEGGPGPDADDEGGDIAEWEPEVVEEEVDEGVLAGDVVPIPTVAPPDIPDPWADGKTPAEGDDTGNWKPPAEREPVPLPSYVPAGEEAMAGAGEFDPASHPVLPGEGEPDIPGPTQMTPLEVAMFMFPRRLIPEGATEVCDEERPNEPYMASYEELIRRAVIGYINVGLEPEDAAIVVAGEVIQAEKMAPDFGGFEEETEDAFEAGLEAAPELTGCIEDYNNGFNTGMKALLDILRGYYAGDEDAVAYGTMLWLEAQMAGMKK